MAHSISVDERTKALFKGCSTEEILRRAQQVKEEAINKKGICYGCISQLYFLETHLYKNPFYEEYLQQHGGLKDKKVVDVGCCLGLDTRQMLLDGLEYQNLAAFDVSKDFISLGFQLFEETGSELASRFFAKSVLDTDLATFIQERYHLIPCDLVLVNSVLHSFDEALAKVAVENVASLLKADGCLLGYVPTKTDNPGQSSAGENGYRFYHTESSLQKLLEKNGFENIKVNTIPIEEMFPSFHPTQETGMEGRIDVTFFKANKKKTK
ncbi:hypothetical protein Gasu2_58840 [Galdieria sulphuraria]|uniref:Methyltransferase domain-containing protein n=1 Tax=Galdieria sulphuraria TaxID=130081 RepID=M2XWL6_GALSU|nr:uncharacterized protein Gasu_45120 [Galdieria sulphuraria]EME28013.1 hypothetical protein Gasu_45120 [Galdieria sulphuraria]GJD11758.1 hypothetical protein Gasu2_58840 [Galdieria sulphuraria]|eukprot:XP_005704533.1 hypothetical protein Gasu_45120 [Galdieria sulphuraria]